MGAVPALSLHPSGCSGCRFRKHTNTLWIPIKYKYCTVPKQVKFKSRPTARLRPRNSILHSPGLEWRYQSAMFPHHVQSDFLAHLCLRLTPHTSAKRKLRKFSANQNLIWQIWPRNLWLEQSTWKERDILGRRYTRFTHAGVRNQRN